MVIFIGDKPSSKNLDPEIPFVGTKSYETLLNWIVKLELDITNVILANKEHVNLYGNGFHLVSTKWMDLDIINGEDKVIALGKEASKYLKKLNIEHFIMDHPSGLNRKLNDTKYVENKLKECKEYLERP